MIKDENRREIIEKSLVMAFSVTNFYSQGKNKDETILYLTELLFKTEFETKDILASIDLFLRKSKNAPTLADIIEILEGPNNNKITQEIETKWQYFLDFAFSPHNKLEAWAYDIKKTMGSSRIENFYAKDLDTWFKKGFVEHVTRQINGEIEVIGDQRKWVQVGNRLCLESSKKKEPSMKMIGKVLKNKEEYDKMSKFKINKYIESLSESEYKAIKDEVYIMARKELFSPKIDENNAFFKSMVQAKLNLVVAERIKKEESVKPKLRVVA